MNIYFYNQIFRLIVIILVISGVWINGTDGHPPGESFDFVVVGGGTAGCTVASRLSESGRFSVLLLEVGGYPHPGLDIPQLGPLYTSSEEHAKTYQMQITTTGNSRRNMTYLVGRTLGGSSSVNGMVWNRGSPYDYDNWANITGDPSWKYENMLKYLKRVETYMGDFPSDQHGYSGHITVSRPKYAPGMQTILDAGRYLGYPIRDPNGPQMVNFTPIEFSKRWGRRVSSFTGYLKPYLGYRKNLKVVTGARVERILFDNHIRKGIRAVGVMYSKEEDKSSHFARGIKEIIISAGVIESAALLMRSGIGPKDILESAGIPVIKELPVGRNFHDHPMVRLQVMINDSTQVLLPDRDFTEDNYLKYNLTGEGPYSTHDADNVQAFLASNFSGSSGNWPDLQLQFVSSGLSTRRPENILQGDLAMSGMLYVVRPKSRGRLTLNSTDPNGDPILDLKYFQDPLDMEIYLDGIQRALKVFEETPSFQRIGARYPTIPISECSGIPFRSREYWKCFVWHRFLSGLHGAGTCRMGKHDPWKRDFADEEPDAVVDSSLRVIGIHGLRVADASIMPQVTNANTQAPVYAIAEKASQMILEAWNEKIKRRDEARRFSRFRLHFKG